LAKSVSKKRRRMQSVNAFRSIEAAIVLGISVRDTAREAEVTSVERVKRPVGGSCFLFVCMRVRVKRRRRSGSVKDAIGAQQKKTCGSELLVLVGCYALGLNAATRREKEENEAREERERERESVMNMQMMGVLEAPLVHLLQHWREGATESEICNIKRENPEGKCQVKAVTRRTLI
jgi:hypothetical protein